MVEHVERSRSQMRQLVLATCLGSICRDGPDAGIQIDFPPLRQPDLPGPARRNVQELEGGLGVKAKAPKLFRTVSIAGRNLPVRQGGVMERGSSVPEHAVKQSAA